MACTLFAQLLKGEFIHYLSDFILRGMDIEFGATCQRMSGNTLYDEDINVFIIEM